MPDTPPNPFHPFHSSDRLQKSSPRSSASPQPLSNPPVQPIGAPATNTTSSSGSGSSSLNPRSCVTCRRRKVKCDKRHPCSNCTRAHIECIYPAPGRAPRKVKKPADGDLMDRLKRLEGIVQSLEPEIEEQHNTNGSSRQDSRSEEPSTLSSSEEKAWSPAPPFNENLHVAGVPSWSETKDSMRNGLENRFGRLVVHEGKSRYVNNSFWASLSNEVEDIKSILNDASDDEADSTPPMTTLSHGTSELPSFIFNYSSSNVDISRLHPPPHTLKLYLQLFKENVDPVVKVLHMPTAEPSLLAHADGLDKLPRGLEVLFFAVYYGTITSLSPVECLENFGEERCVLLERYQFGVQQGLARANFLITEEIVVLQAFTLFLQCLRRNDDARTIWTLTGLIVRIAQTMGIHRDGSHFNLSPFEVEMRRRLWWQICILDARASEDHGCDPTVIDQLFDTDLPLNVNDEDISPDMKEFPEERTGFTEMTFSLIRCEVTVTFRHINYVPANPKPCFEKFASTTLEEKKRWVTECHERLEDRYLKHCDMTVPLYWVTATVCRLIMAKMWLMIYHPFQRKDGGRSLPQDVKDKLFLTSLENIEYMILLDTEARTMKWGWLIRTYVQWHALAFLLTELCTRTKGPMIDRAWAAVEKTMKTQTTTHPDDKRGHLWKPLRKLWAKAKAVRTRELEEEQLALQRARATLFDGNIQTRLFEQSVNTNPEKFSSDPGRQSGLHQLDSQQGTIVQEQAELQDATVPLDPANYDIGPSILASNGERSQQPQNHSDPASAFTQSRPTVLQQPRSFDSGLGLASPSTIASNIQVDMNSLDSVNDSSTLTYHSNPAPAPDGSRAARDFPITGTSRAMTSPEGIPYDLTTGQDGWIDGDMQMNWANFDDMVRQFGMDLDQPGQGVSTNYAPGQGGFAGTNATMPGMENWW